MSLVGTPPVTSVEYDESYVYYFLRQVLSLDARDLMTEKGNNSKDKNPKSDEVPKKIKSLDLIYNKTLEGIHLKPTKKVTHAILEDEFVQALPAFDIESDNRPESLKDALADGTLDSNITTRWKVLRPFMNIVDAGEPKTPFGHAWGELGNSSIGYSLMQYNNHVNAIGESSPNEFQLPCIEREFEDNVEMPFTITFKLFDSPPEVIESLKDKDYNSPCVYFNLQFGDDYYLFEYSEEGTLSYLRVNEAGISTGLSNYSKGYDRASIDVVFSQHINKNKAGEVELTFIPLDSILYIGDTPLAEDIWTPAAVVYRPLSAKEAKQSARKKKKRGPLSFRDLKETKYNLKHMWFGAKYACVQFAFNFMEYSPLGYCDYGPLTIHTEELGAYKEYTWFPAITASENKCYMQGRYNEEILFGSSGSHQYSLLVPDNTFSIDLFAGTGLCNGNQKYIYSPVYYKVEKQYGSRISADGSAISTEGEFSTIYDIATWPLINSVGGSATPMTCTGHEDASGKSFSVSFYNLAAAQTQFSQNLKGVHPVILKFGRDEASLREIKGFIWSDLTTSMSSNTRTLNFTIMDRSAVLKTNFVANMPYYDGYYDTRIIRDLAVRAGYSNGTTNLNFDYITPKEVSTCVFIQQPIWDFAEGTSYWDCMLRVAKWRGAWLFLSEVGEVTYVDPAQYDKEVNSGTLIRFKEVASAGDMLSPNDLIKTKSDTQSFDQVYNQVEVLGTTPMYSPDRNKTLGPEYWQIIQRQLPEMDKLQGIMMDASTEGFTPWRRMHIWRNPDLNNVAHVTKHCELLYKRHSRPFVRSKVSIWGRLDIKPLQLVEIQMVGGEVVTYRIISIDSNLDGTTNKFGMDLVLEKFYGSDSYNFYRDD